MYLGVSTTQEAVTHKDFLPYFPAVKRWNIHLKSHPDYALRCLSEKLQIIPMRAPKASTEKAHPHSPPVTSKTAPILQGILLQV